MKKILSSILFLIICIAVEAQTCSAPIALNIVNGNTYRFWTDSIVGIQSYAWIVTTFEDDTATSSGSYSSTSSAYFAGSTFNSPDYVQVCLTLTFVDGCVSSNCDTFPYCDAGFTYALNEQYGLTLTADFPADYMNELHYWTVNGPGIPNPTQNTEIPTYYVTPGATYNICQQLMITSSGCNTTECQDITIPDTIVPVCDAAFTYYYLPTNAYLNVSSAYTYGQGSFEHNWLVTSYMSDGTVNTNNQLNVNNNGLFVAANTSALEICHTLTNLNTGCVDSSCQYLDFCTAEYTHVIDTANQVLTLTAGGIQTLASHSWNVTYHATGGVYDSEILNGPIATFLLPEGILDMTICHVVNNTFPGSTCSTYACDTIVFCNAEFTVIDNGNGTAGIWAVSPPTPGAVYTWSITGPGYNGAAYSGSYFNFTPVPNEPYYVCMAYFNAETGCSASNCDTVVVEGISDTCSAEFTLNYENFILTGIPVTPYTSGNEYVWTINSSNYGAVSYSSMNFIHTLLPDAGEVTVCLNVTNTFLNCSDVYCDNIQISSPDTTCTAEIVMGFAPDGWPMFSATSNSTIALYSWVLTPYDSNGEAVGTGFYSSQSNSYIPSGVAYVYIEACLELTFTSGCVWNNCQTFTAPPDTANFLPCNAQFSQTGPLFADSSYQFIGVANDSSAYHLWTFGDGSSSTLEMPFHSYEVNGSYSVCHIVGINEACADTVCSVFNYFGTEPQCNAEFTVIDNGNGTFTVSPLSPPAPEAVITWIINGPGFNGSTLAGYPYNFNYPSLNNPFYPISICMTYSNFETGCVATYCDTIVNTCSAEFTYTFTNDNFYTWPLNPHIEGNSYSYTVESSVYGILANNETSSNPGFPIPLDAGTVFICLNLTNEFSLCNATFCDTMSVSPDTSCTADIVAGNGSNGWPEFTVNGGAEIASYNWNITTYDSNGTALEFFSSMQSNASIPAGTAYASIEVSLAIIFETGCQWGGYLTYTAQPDTLCNANYNYTSQVANPLEVLFDASMSVVAGNNPSFTWDFGDGTTGTGTTVSHTYALDGIYTVCLTAYSDSCSNTSCGGVYVGFSDTTATCNASFTMNGPMQPDSYLFTGVNNNSNAYHLWTFGDGTSSTLAMPSHSYTNPGTYQVCHITGIEGVCADTVYNTFYIGLYLAGTVNVGANCIDFGSVKLYSLDTVSNSVELIGQYPMDNNLCYYNFIGLTPGIYLVRAGLSDSSSYYNDYVPTYFGSQYYWNDAEPIYLTQSGDFYNISLIYGSNPGGNGTVNGSIDDGPFRLSNPALSTLISPVLGAQVVITDLANVPQRWVRTDNSGAFSISDLAYGTYRLMADEPGMTCLPIEFTLSEQTPGVTIDLVMGDEISGIVSYETALVQGDVYPNPSNTLAKLNIELMKPASLKFTMTSITGQTTWIQTSELLAGKSTIQIPVQEMSDGLYLLSIYSENGQLLTTRKMQVLN